MYQLKQQSSDFLVKEITNIKPLKEGVYSIFLLKKEDYTTEKAISLISEILKIPRKNIGYAGNKDRKAITEQYISIRGLNSNDVNFLNKLKAKNIALKYIGKTDKPISLGDLEGNYFEITIRNLDQKEAEKIQLLKKLKKILMPNYFGEQRFSNNNAEVGKNILKKDFKEAINLILKNKGNYETKIEEYLKTNPTNYVGALRLIPKKILQMYIHAYQSYLWNKVVSLYLKNNKKERIKNIQIPIIGFGTEIKNTKIKGMVNKVLKDEKINFNDFVIRAIPELSSEGYERDVLMEVKNLKVSNPEKDELNKNKYKLTLEFTLNKGSYATVAISELAKFYKLN